MKTITYSILTALLFLFTTTTRSQTILIEPSQVIFEKSIKQCISSKVDPEKEVLTKAWAKFLQKNYKVKLKGFGLFSNSDVLSAENVVLSNISDLPINLYTNIETTTTGSVIRIFSSNVNKVFMDSINSPVEYKATWTMLRDFLIKYTNEYYNDKISRSANSIKQLNKDKIKLLNSIEKNRKKIIKLSNKISTTDVTIKENNAEKVKAVEKISKLSTEKTKLENDNSTSVVKIDYIEKQINDEKARLEHLKTKRVNIL